MSANIKILYLEYIAGDTAILNSALGSASVKADILAVNDKQGFLDTLKNFPPDIIISDIALPALSTTEALAILKQQGLIIPLIVLTAQSQCDRSTLVNIMKQGVYDYILKENIAELPDAIIYAIEKHTTGQKLLLSELHEQALKRSEANLSAIIENTTDLVYSLDTHLRFITFNQLFKITIKAVYGFIVEQGVGIMDQMNAFDAEMGEKWHDIYQRALNGQALQFVNEYTFGDGKVYLSYSINPIRETGKVIGLSCFSRDITSQKLLELEREKITTDLLQRNKALEQFTYIISHNLRAPVANILGLSALSQTLEIEDDEVSDIINNISRSAYKLDEVISDLNQVLQVNKGINENIELILLPELIEDIRFSIKDLVEKEQVDIICNFSESGELFSLKSFLYSIFYNLIHNSIKYRRFKVNPVISISSRADNGKLIITYKDNGRGIDTKKYADELFGLYKRFDTSVEGKGMGLFMIKMQVESLGGTVSLKSAINKGTEFLLEFPLLHLEKSAIQN